MVAFRNEHHDMLTFCEKRFWEVTHLLNKKYPTWGKVPNLMEVGQVPGGYPRSNRLFVKTSQIHGTDQVKSL